MKILFGLLLIGAGLSVSLAQQIEKAAPQSPEVAARPKDHSEMEVLLLQRLVHLVEESGRILEIGQKRSERVSPSFQIAPGPSPLVSFRYLEGKRRHRFGNLDLVMDDAGH